jgi:hypothetical protein
MKKITLSIYLLLVVSTKCLAQKANFNWFIRNAHIANQNLTSKSIYYTPALATGFGISKDKYFAELATFVNKSDNYGFFSFFGRNIKKSDLEQDIFFYTNLFGEVTYFPKQNNNSPIWIKTAGICFFINKEYQWGALGIPICVGLAESNQTISLNSRLLFNVSIKL